MTWYRWAKFWLDCYDRMTNGFERPMDTFTQEELTRMWHVDDWFIRVAPRLMKEVLHPKHATKMRKGIAYLTALKELQDEAWRPVFESIKRDGIVLDMLERGKITKQQYLDFITNG